MPIDNGWIKLHRKILTWEWYDDINVSRLFIHLLLKANHETKKWRGETIKKGELVTGRQKLAQETHLSEQNIRTSLTKLKSTNEITIRTTNDYSVITINNFTEHQQTNQRTNQRLTNDQPTTNQRLTTTKELKNEKNDKKKIESYIELFNKLASKQYTVTDGRTSKLNSRLTKFTYEQVETALRNMLNDPFYTGKNDRNWSATPEWLIATDEKVDRFLNTKSKFNSLNPL